MLEHTRDILSRAESLAGSTECRIELVLGALRELALEEFGELMLSMPDRAYPNLTACLPSMTGLAMQEMWTGASGLTLHRQTAAFVRQLELAYTKGRGEALAGKTILDFGVGYGRIMRLLYYYSDPHQIWGVDAWDASLRACEEAGMLGNFRQSDRVPTGLPVGDVKFDVGFAFSVFTHLEPTAAAAALDALRICVKKEGIFVATVRPVEFWEYLDKVRGLEVSADKIRDHHEQGHAYLPHGGADGETYGDTSLPLKFFERPGWKVIGRDWSRGDHFQVSAILQAV